MFIVFYDGIFHYGFNKTGISFILWCVYMHLIKKWSCRLGFKCLMAHNIPLYYTVISKNGIPKEGKSGKGGRRKVWRERKGSIFICYWNVERWGGNILLVIKNKVNIFTLLQNVQKYTLFLRPICLKVNKQLTMKI